MDLINKNKIQKIIDNADSMSKEQMIKALQSLVPAWSDFDIRERVDKAYCDGYQAGYIQGTHDNGGFDRVYFDQ